MSANALKSQSTSVLLTTTGVQHTSVILSYYRTQMPREETVCDTIHTHTHTHAWGESRSTMVRVAGSKASCSAILHACSCAMGFMCVSLSSASTSEPAPLDANSEWLCTPSHNALRAAGCVVHNLFCFPVVLDASRALTSTRAQSVCTVRVSVERR